MQHQWLCWRLWISKHRASSAGRTEKMFSRSYYLYNDPDSANSSRLVSAYGCKFHKNIWLRWWKDRKILTNEKRGQHYSKKKPWNQFDERCTERCATLRQCLPWIANTHSIKTYPQGSTAILRREHHELIWSQHISFPFRSYIRASSAKCNYNPSLRCMSIFLKLIW